MATGKRDLLYGKDGYAKFEGKAYLESFYRGPTAESGYGDFNETRINFFHNVFKKFSIRGDRLVDIGCGPSLLQVISASATFNNITLAEYIEDNRNQIKKWINKDSNSHDWTPFFKYIALLEGDGDNWQNVESRMRYKIKEVVPCDVLQENPLVSCNVEPYDCIISSLCLESACKTIDELNSAVKSLMKILNPGGKLVLSGVTKCKFYAYNQTDMFHCLSMTKGDLETAIEKAGGKVLYYEGKRFEEEPTKSMLDELFILVAEKV